MSCSWLLRAALGVSALAVGVSIGGCIEDADCGVCNPESLVLESISGINYTSDKIHVLSPPCEGGRCPAPFTKGSYFIEDIGPCEETEAAQATPNPEEYCKISPLVTWFGIEFVFNNLLDAQSIELVRKSPANPQLFEVYDWKVDVLHIEGPITRWNGDYQVGEGGEEPDVMTRMVNLSCVDNLGPGFGYSHEHYEDPATNPCNDMVDGKPLKMREDGEVHSYRGIWSAWGNSCSTSQEGPDTCCTFCEWLLSTKVERYGVAENGLPRSPLANANGGLYDGDPSRPYSPALVCRTPADEDAFVDTYSRCADFRVAIDRSDEEQRWTYEWCVGEASADCEVAVGTFSLPRVDLLRETHPDKRPREPVAGLPPWQWPPRYEQLTASCRGGPYQDCGTEHGLPGTECMGVHIDTHEACVVAAYPDGECTPTGTETEALPENAGGFCRPEWFVGCLADQDTVGAEEGYCVDKRFGTTGSAACKATTERVECVNAGDVVGGSTCDVGYGQRTATDATLGAGFRVGCEPDGTNCSSPHGGGRLLSECDWNENGSLTAAECCTASIAGPGLAGQTDGFACDPFYQSNLIDRPLYERDANLPEQTETCRCPTGGGSLEEHGDDLEADGCFEVAAIGCFDGSADDDPSERMLREDRAGEYAVKFVTQPGGVVYDPAIKGIDWKPADTGGVPRADIEQCAMDNVDHLIEPLNRHDGWRAQDAGIIENFEDFDRAMCSGQSYKVVFAEPGDDGPHIVDKVGNTLEGKSVYTFETPQFHVVPGSGFPTDNLRIGACDDYRIDFSNKYDVSPENLNKIQLYRLRCTGEGVERVCEMAPPNPKCDLGGATTGMCCEEIAPGVYPPVAGGPGCYETGSELREALKAGEACARPCLTADVKYQYRGELGVEIDSAEFKQVLDEGEIYRMIVPYAATFDDAASNPALYDAVFWDVCGMPLVSDDAVSYEYEFEIDPPKCKEDTDGDGIPFSCDNADRTFNPEQEDIDLDGVGDVVDLCPVQGGDSGNMADSDLDGVGNECDTCRQIATAYNAGIEMSNIPPEMWIRNVPYQDDADEDGIGDVCDNCVSTPNCEGYGNTDGLAPYHVGDPIAYSNEDRCQGDKDGNFIGDACDGGVIVGMRATAPIGFSNADDFDQDGISNMSDKCPRQPIREEDAIECETQEDCPATRSCEEGWCNHRDSDFGGGDAVGDECDTCPFSANGEQVLEGGMQSDDDDSDFVGEACETQTVCDESHDTRPFGFHTVQSNGNCCTTALVAAEEDYDNPDDNPEEHAEDVLVGDLLLATTCDDAERLNGENCLPLRAPHPENSAWTLPVRKPEDCTEEQVGGVWVCRKLPPEVATGNGILTPPPGCDAALETAGMSALQNLLLPLTDKDFSGESDPFDALWQNMCFLPQPDQDFDDWGDPCDLCPFAFDPGNEKFLDPETGRLWPQDGKYCNGEYLPDVICEKRDEPEPGAMDESGSGSSSGGSESSDTGGSGG